MIAGDVRDTDLAGYQRAARTLLVHPLVTATSPNADALPLVRRFGAPLGRDLDAVAGYRLELSPTCARLVKRADRLDPTQAIQLTGKKPFDRRRYAYLCLVLGAVGRAGGQVALTELAEALRRRAADVDGLGFDPDEYRHRLAFVDVVLHLESLGVMRRVETSTISWLKDPDAGEALYDVDRDAAHQAFVPPRVVQHVNTVRSMLAGDLSASRDQRRAASRQRISRLVLEHPVVYVDDLPEADRAYLRNQARSLADDLARLTGAQLERRAEGLALVDTVGGFGDRAFPRGGTPAQVALLMADAIARAVAADHGDTWSPNGNGSVLGGNNADETRAGAPEQAGRPDPGGEPTIGAATIPAAADLVARLADRLDAARPGRLSPDDDELAQGLALPDEALVPAGHGGAVGDGATGSETPTRASFDDGGAGRGPFLPDAWLAGTVEALVASHGKAFASDLRDDPVALRREAVDVLVAFDLVRPVPGGVVARPAIARYREVRVQTAQGAQLSMLDLDAQAYR